MQTNTQPGLGKFVKISNFNKEGRDDPNGHTTSNPRRFDVDITSIRRRPNFDEFPRHFRVLFRCNFDGRKIHVVFTYFFQCYFAGRKSTLFPRTFSNVISMVEKSMCFHVLFSMKFRWSKNLPCFHVLFLM